MSKSKAPKPSLASRNASAAMQGSIRTGNGSAHHSPTGPVPGPPTKSANMHDPRDRRGNLIHPEPSDTISHRTSNPSFEELKARTLKGTI